jgi:ribosomal protein L11 methyltransferase
LRLASIGAGRFRVREQLLKPWNALVRSRYPVQRLGHFAIVPAWKSRLKLPTGLHPIYLVQGQAFGTGLHESTRLMLEGLSALKGLQGAQVLDVGAGSGILGFAALHLGARRVTGVELEAAACAELRENRALNHVPARDFAVLPGAYPLRRLRGKRYPLILANLVSPLLLSLMGELRRQLSPGGRLLCSGIFKDGEAAAVASAARRAGLRWRAQAALKDWRRLDLQRP